MKIKKPTQEQLSKVTELFTKMVNREITEEQYTKGIKENAKK